MAIKRYLRLYWVFLKRNILTTATYRFSLFLELFVEVGYQFAFVLLFDVLFSRVTHIGGWSHDEMLFFLGLNMIISEFVLSTLFIGSLFKLPNLILKGDIDMWLTKPVNSMYMLTLGNPYVSGLLSTFPGFYLIYRSVQSGAVVVDPLKWLIGLIVLVCGLVICYSISVIITSLSFVFVGAVKLPRFTSDLVWNFSAYPVNVFERPLRSVLTFGVPLLFLVAIPAQIMVKGLSISYLTIGIGLSVGFLLLAIHVWKHMISRYSSASS